MISIGLKKLYTSNKKNFIRSFIEDLLGKADIHVNGTLPWDMKIHHESVFSRIFSHGSLGLGESYMDGLWDCDRLDECMFKIINADLSGAISKDLQTFLHYTKAKVMNRQSITKATEVAKRHYDIGNDIYEAMLDKRMIYTCADWSNATSLDAAQVDKLDLVCKKLKLRAGQRILDIGCGWGGFAKFAAERYGVEVVGITISQEQAKWAQEVCRSLPVEIRVQDYRAINEMFDHVVSIGMFEHVGYKNYETFMEVVHRALRNNGLFLLRCIGGNHSVFAADAWINKYIFPNGMNPSIAQIGKAVEHKFIMEEWQNTGPFYDLTIMEWLKRFKDAWPILKAKYDDRFYRMWVYYLSCSAASFRAKTNNLWQIVFSKQSDLIHYSSNVNKKVDM